MWIPIELMLGITFATLGSATICSLNESRRDYDVNTCRNVQLPILSQDFYKTKYTRIMIIRESNIPIVQSTAFSNIQSQVMVYMENVGIETIMPDAFNTMTLLRELYLSGNRIDGIKFGVLNTVHNLTILDLSKNRIQYLEQHSLAGSLHFKTLNLSSNTLRSFNTSVFDNATDISCLDLSFNMLKYFNLEMVAISNLNLSNNRLENITGCLSQFSNLNLGRNSLTTLYNSNQTCSLSNLTDLDISFNNISSLNSQWFYSLGQLKILNLQGNKISSIPNAVLFNMHELKLLNLSHNYLVEFQHGLFDPMSSLSILDLSWNKIANLKRYLHSLKKLQELYIAHNKLSDMDFRQLLIDLPSLSDISIDDNAISCDKLIEILYISRDQGIISPGNSKNESNVKGIACVDDSDSLRRVYSQYVTDTTITNVKDSSCCDDVSEVVKGFKDLVSNKIERVITMYKTNNTDILLISIMLILIIMTCLLMYQVVTKNTVERKEHVELLVV